MDTHHRGSQARLNDLDTQLGIAQDEHSFKPVANFQGFETLRSVTQGKKEVVAARKPARWEEHTVKQSIPKCLSIICGTKFSIGSSWSSVYTHCIYWLSQACNSQFPDQLHDRLMLIAGYFVYCNPNQYWIFIFFLEAKFNPPVSFREKATKLPASEGYSLPCHCKRH